jgi:hypothetical protein
LIGDHPISKMNANFGKLAGYKIILYFAWLVGMAGSPILPNKKLSCKRRKIPSQKEFILAGVCF